MAEKKYKGRKAYLNDFRKNEKGDYEYQGILYAWEGEKKELQRSLLILWILCIFMLAALAAAGCVEAPGPANCFYVVLPYAVSFVFGISSAWGLCRLTRGGNPLRAYIYQASVEAIPVRTLCTMIGAAAAILGELVFLLLNGTAKKLPEILLFIVLEVLSFVLAGLFRKHILQMQWKKQKIN